MEQVAWKKEQKISEYEAAKRAASDFMQYMESGERCEVFYDKQQEGLMLSERRDNSSGYEFERRLSITDLDVF